MDLAISPSTMQPVSWIASLVKAERNSSSSAGDISVGVKNNQKSNVVEKKKLAIFKPGYLISNKVVVSVNPFGIYS